MAQTGKAGGGKGDTDSCRADIIKMLQEDQKHIRAELVRNESIGETRFQFFVGWVSAAIGGLIALAQSTADPDFINGITVAGLSGLLGIGLMTYARIVHRNRVTDYLGRMSDDVQKRLLLETDSPKGGDYELFWPSGKLLSGPIRGGYAEVIGAIDGALLGALLHVWLDLPLCVAIPLGAVFGVGLWWAAIYLRKVPLGETTMGSEQFLATRGK